MKKIVLDEILGFAAYEKVRDEFRREIIDKKKLRRVAPSGVERGHTIIRSAQITVTTGLRGGKSDDQN